MPSKLGESYPLLFWAGTVLAPFWNRSGNVLEPFWNRFGTVLEAFQYRALIAGISERVLNGSKTVLERLPHQSERKWTGPHVNGEP